MPSSLHSHSGQFCSHATGTLDQCIQSAIQLKFKTYGLSEHCPRFRNCDLYPEEIEAGLSIADLSMKFENFVNMASELQKSYESQIELLVGVETEYISASDLNHLQLILQKFQQIDYVVASVHHVAEIPIDFSLQLFEKALSTSGGWNTFLTEYFSQLYLIMQQSEPEVIGHLDLYRLYHQKIRLQDYPEALAACLQCIRLGVSYGALFECSSAPFRKGWTTAYPGPELLSILISQGAKLTLSDDSHGPDRTGLNYPKLRAYLIESGVQDMYSLRLVDKSLPRKSGRTEVVALQWNDDHFWDSDAMSNEIKS